jgi:hypothetical protein
LQEAAQKDSFFFLTMRSYAQNNPIYADPKRQLLFMTLRSMC